MTLPELLERLFHQDREDKEGCPHILGQRVSDRWARLCKADADAFLATHEGAALAELVEAVAGWYGLSTDADGEDGHEWDRRLERMDAAAEAFVALEPEPSTVTVR